MSLSTERPARAALVGVLIAACITLPGLGAGTLWDNSETAYGEVAREILLTHDWVVMHLNGTPWFIQPPLYFWIAALIAKILGPTSLALRLPSALATILAGGITGYAVARQAGTRVGIYASVMLSSCLMQAVIGRLAIMDSMLDVAVAFTIFWWFRALESGRDRYFVYGWAAAGFGFLTKGLVAPVVALLVIVPFALWNMRAEPTHSPSWRGWIAGLAAFALIVSPWLIGIVAQAGPQALVTLLAQYTIGRYTGVIENQAGPLWYYVPVLILGFFPWIAFFPVAFAYAMRLAGLDDVDPNRARLARLSIVWIVAPLLFFSFAKTKLPNYIALEFPALALCTALYFDRIVRKGVSRAAIVSAATVPIFIGVLAFAFAAFSHDNHFPAAAYRLSPVLIAMGTAIFIGSIVTAVWLARAKTAARAPYALAASMLVAMDALAVFALGRAEAFKPVPKLAAIIQRDRRPGDAVAIQSYRGANALVFYTQPGVLVIGPPDETDGDDNPRRTYCGYARVWLVAPAQRPAYDPNYGRSRAVKSTVGTAALFLIDGAPCSTR